MVHHEIDSEAALLAFVRAHGHLRGQAIQELDLRPHAALLQGIEGAGAAFLGCTLDAQTIAHLYRTGADLFPPLSEGMALPFRPYRSGLYTVEELYEGFDPGREGSFWTDARDSAIYRYFTERREAGVPVAIMEALAMRLHDHAIEDAVYDLLHPAEGEERRVVAVMGGHAMRRDQPIFADVARMARTLTRDGFFIATGGGPGAMEASNLGAYFAPFDDGALDQALELLANETDYRAHAYLEFALQVRRRWPPRDSAESLAIPTWFYGHEPTNMFASHVAKYFANSVREDGLLAIAKYGVVYAPGSAGTIQEVFMDACQNHYVTCEVMSPMVLLGVDHWTHKLPVWPLLRAMSEGRPWGELVRLCDRGAEAAAFIRQHPPRS